MLKKEYTDRNYGRGYFLSNETKNSILALLPKTMKDCITKMTKEILIVLDKTSTTIFVHFALNSLSKRALMPLNKLKCAYFETFSQNFE